MWPPSCSGAGTAQESATPTVNRTMDLILGTTLNPAAQPVLRGKKSITAALPDPEVHHLYFTSSCRGSRNCEGTVNPTSSHSNNSTVTSTPPHRPLCFTIGGAESLAMLFVLGGVLPPGPPIDRKHSVSSAIYSLGRFLSPCLPAFEILVPFNRHHIKSPQRGRTRYPPHTLQRGRAGRTDGLSRL